ncbi:MAG: flagellar basal body rod protein FlgB [Sulfurimonas sp.]|nr:flagellar basal body rod protein FlgB [Sulfurimonas sp.]
MGIQEYNTRDLVASALDYRSIRQDMISSNIANADTPFYRPRDISFGDTLAAKQAELYKNEKTTLDLAQTNSAHMPFNNEKDMSKATMFYRDGHMARNDGNSVDLDVETTEMSKNSIMFNALVNADKKLSMMYKSVIDSSSKVS